MAELNRTIELLVNGNSFSGRFSAMASVCEVLVDGASEKELRKLTEIAASEAWRIEQTFSRYRDDNIIHRLNTANGQAVQVDDETSALLDFGTHAFQISDGKFDLSSGVLRRIWTFDGSDNIPSRRAANELLALVGWNKISWQRPYLTMPKGMEIDFGGIGKEYAVDRAMGLLKNETDAPLLINFGGDLAATKPPARSAHWTVGVESVAQGKQAIVQLEKGGLATSGNRNRYLLRDGIRYPHVLNPLTAWPVMDAPDSVTVAAGSCVEAGLIATLAMLEGADAKEFLDAQSLIYWLQ